MQRNAEAIATLPLPSHSPMRAVAGTIFSGAVEGLQVRLLLLLAVGLAPASAWAVVFDDGQLHVIDAGNSFPAEDVIVRDGPASTATTVRVLPGGHIGTSCGAQCTIGGGLIAEGSSSIEILGGSISGQVIAKDDSKVQIFDGDLQESVNAQDSSSISVSGGTIGLLTATQNGQVRFRNGTVVGIGPSDKVLSVGGNALVTLLGGALEGQLEATSNAGLTVYGGALTGPLIVLGVSSTTILGEDFSLPLGTVGSLSGTLSGTLSNGLPFSLEFLRETTAAIHLTEATDSDGDGFRDGLDNCRHVFNPDQMDMDSDGVGDACNDANDSDGDEWSDVLDNCPMLSNALQADADLDFIGDACDLCPDWPSSGADFDDNGIGDECECGDQTMDGVVNVTDLLAINDVIFGVVPASPLCDTNNDGLCNVEDILGANAKLFGAPAYCARYPEPTESVEFRSISGDFSGFGLGAANDFVIRDESAWCSFWDQAHSGISPAPPCDLGVVDFESEIALASFIGARPCTSYQATITQVQSTPSGSALNTSVAEIVPGPNCGCFTAISYPVAVVAVPGPVGKVTFEHATEVFDCLF